MYSTLQEKKPMKKFRVLKAKILIEEDQSELRTKRITKNFKIKQISVTPNSNLVQIKDQKNDTDQILFQGVEDAANLKKTDGKYF